MKKNVKILSLVLLLLLVTLAMASCGVVENVKETVAGGINSVKEGVGSAVDKVTGIFTGDKPCEHSWVDADCTTPKKCKLCGETDGEVREHTPETVSGYDATCDAEGKADGTKCSVCGKMLIAQQIIPANGHTPGASATCTEDQICTVCGYVIDEKHHIPEAISGLAPTCTDEGKTDGIKCSVCDEVVIAQATIPATGHTPGTAATCTEDQTCTVCGDVIVGKHPNTSVVPGFDATCIAEGLTDGLSCADCGEVITAQAAIPAKGHTPGADATCTEDQTCTVCGDMIAAKHHTPEAVIGYDSTCTEEGLTDGLSCAVCGEVITAQAAIPAKGHTPGADETCTTDQTCTVCGITLVEMHHDPVTVRGYAATCTDDGKTDGVSCADCGEVITAQQTIAATGHTPGAAANCTTDQICTVCSAILVEKYHVSETVPGYAATCTAKGKTDGEKCSICGKTLKSQTTIPAKGHTKQTVPAVAPTCTDKGLTEGVKCAICDYVITKQTEVAAKGHTFVDESLCTDCGQPYYSEGMIFEYNEYKGYYIVTRIGSFTGADIVIPSTYNGVAVGEIGGDFTRYSSYKANFRSITIPSSVQLIGEIGSSSSIGPFSGCENLKKVYIESIESWFDVRVSTQGISNPLYYGAELYAGGELVTEVTVPDSITQLERDYFNGCSSITKINLHNSLYVLSGFCNLPNLTEIVIPTSVKIIQGGAFSGCTSLASISIPDRTYHIYDGAFKNTAYYNNEENWDQGKVLYIGKHLIVAKTDISGEYTVKAGTNSIASGAFSGCRNLTGLNLNSELIVIKDRAFSGTSALMSITIPANVRYIGYSAFDGMGGSNKVNLEIKFEYTGAWYLCGGLYNNLSSSGYIYGNKTSSVVIYYVNNVKVTGGYGATVNDYTYSREICR